VQGILYVDIFNQVTSENDWNERWPIFRNFFPQFLRKIIFFQNFFPNIFRGKFPRNFPWNFPLKKRSKNLLPQFISQIKNLTRFLQGENSFALWQSLRLTKFTCVYSYLSSYVFMLANV
jgi:hypothetical protein